MNEILKNLIKVIVFVDDILVGMEIKEGLSQMATY